MVLLGDEAEVQGRFGLFRDSTSFDARKVHGLRRTYHRLGNLFWTYPMESRFGLFGDSVCRCKIGALFAPNVP